MTVRFRANVARHLASEDEMTEAADFTSQFLDKKSAR